MIISEIIMIYEYQHMIARKTSKSAININHIILYISADSI